MSQSEVIATTRALLEDATLGFKAKLAALAAGNPIAVSSEMRFVKWALAGTMQQATMANVMLRPGTWRPDAKNDGRPHRDAFASIEVGFETFAADPDVIQETAILAATALAQVLDGLVDYAQLNGGTIADIEDPIQFEFGQFVGPTSNGFLARVTLFERSSQ